MADTSTDIRSLIRADRTQPDSAAVAHVVVSVVFLALGSLGALAALLSMAFPSFIPLGYGVLRAITMLALLVGFATVSVIGGVYYVLPRLTGSPLWNERLAWLGLLLIAATTGLGIIVVGAGFGDGGEPFALPWWLDLPLLAGLALPALVSLQTVRHKQENRVYVTIPYVLIGLLAMPLLYLAANLPGLTSLASTLGDLWFSAAYPVAAILLTAVGLGYYAVVKEDRPLAGRQLAWIGLWSILFGAGWFGVAQLAGGPVPDWLGAIAAAGGLAFPVGMIATAASLVSTLEGSWRSDEGTDPVVMTAVAGTGLGVLVAVLAALAGFRSAATLVAFTPYWEAVNYGLVLGVIPLLIASWTYQALPRMTGRRIFSRDDVRRQVRLTLLGTGGLVLLLVLAGLATGYSWAGGAFTGTFAAVGDGWATASAPGRIFTGLAVVPGIVAVLGNLGLVAVIFLTITQGHVGTQEVLVSAGDEAEDA